MSFTTYENTSNPHVTVHRNECSQIMKRGGEHKYNNGQYKKHDSLPDAKKYAEITKLPIKFCAFCKP
jgi:hypothetical protein